MRIAFDLDGVITDFNTEYIKRLNKHFNKNYSLGEPSSWNSYDQYKDFTPDMQNEMFELISNEKDFWRLIKPLNKGNIHSIRDLISDGNVVYFVTNRCPNPDYDSTLLQSNQWLLDHFIHSCGVILTKNKSEACKLLKLDYFLDDYTENVKNINNNSDTICYILDKKYNKEYKTIYRVKSIDEYIEKIRKETKNGRLHE